LRPIPVRRPELHLVREAEELNPHHRRTRSGGAVAGSRGRPRLRGRPHHWISVLHDRGGDLGAPGDPLYDESMVGGLS
jgi:hypothetical protein